MSYIGSGAAPKQSEFPIEPGTSGNVLTSDGTTWTSSAPTIPVTPGTSGNVLTSNGTSWTSAAATIPVSPGTSGNVLTSDGTNWTSAAAAAFDTGTKMVFQQTAAPTGWTKDTTHDNKAFRVVSGTASTGGSVAFTTAFASQTPSGSVSVSISSVTGSAGSTTLSTPQIPSHNHSFPFKGGPGDSQQGISGTGEFQTVTTSSTGGGGSHTHPFSFSSGSGTGTFSGNAINMAVQYVDLIIATKD